MKPTLQKTILERRERPDLETDRMASPRAATRKPYARPAIVHELALETRAGSALGMPNGSLQDLLNPGE